MDLKELKLYFDDRVENGVFRVHKNLFSDPKQFFKPVQSLQAELENFNDVGLHSTYRGWLRLMEAGAAGRGAFD